jgi:hypothetical protein
VVRSWQLETYSAIANMDLKLGVSNILGIIAPGSLLVVGLTVTAVGVEEYWGFHGYRAILTAVTGKEIIFTTGGLLIAYLFGSSVRLFANDVAEISSGWYLRIVRRNHSPIATQRFPYPFVTEWIDTDIGPQVTAFLRSQSPTFGAERTKHFFNYCKMIVRARAPERADYLETIESYVRFLAGALVSSTLTACLCLPLSIAFLVGRRFEIGSAYCMISLTMLIVIVSVLERFRYQHSREVINTWLAYYECAKYPEVAQVART